MSGSTFFAQPGASGPRAPVAVRGVGGGFAVAMGRGHATARRGSCGELLLGLSWGSHGQGQDLTPWRAWCAWSRDGCGGAGAYVDLRETGGRLEGYLGAASLVRLEGAERGGVGHHRGGGLWAAGRGTWKAWRGYGHPLWHGVVGTWKAWWGIGQSVERLWCHLQAGASGLQKTYLRDRARTHLHYACCGACCASGRDQASTLTCIARARAGL